METDGTLKNDVWYSTDGNTWVSDSNAGWSPRRGLAALVFDGKIWIFGGVENGGALNDVWCSTNGKNWTQVTSSANWSARCGHTAAAFDNKMWVLGGCGKNGALTNDVWCSADGNTWMPDSSADWSARCGHATVEFDSTIWVLGGEKKNDVWKAGLNGVAEIQPALSNCSTFLYPNPSRKRVFIKYEVPINGSVVKLTIYNLAGRVIKVLVGGIKDAGWYEVHWDKRDGYGKLSPAGIYLCTLAIFSNYGKELKTTKKLTIF